MPPKKKRLPKNFRELIQANDLESLVSVFATVGIDARDGTSGPTALGVYGVPPAFAQWLIDQGADIEAADAWGATPLFRHARVGNDELVKVLLDAGAAMTGSDGTSEKSALLQAADGHHHSTIKLLLDRGADPLPRAGNDSVLAQAMRTCRNADIAATAEIATTLVAAGTVITPEIREEVRRIGAEFEFHRLNFNPDYLAETDAGLTKLYDLFDVRPVEARRTHDGEATITVTATDWQGQHEELWELLVPGSGAAATVQGEVIRITGKISHEMFANGGMNWDIGFKGMLAALQTHLGSGVALPEPELTEVAQLAKRVRTDDDAPARLCELAVAWVLANPEPDALKGPAYKR